MPDCLVCGTQGAAGLTHACSGARSRLGWGCKPTRRCVWLTVEQRHDLAVVHGHEGTIGEVIAAWDAAPADSVEAVEKALSRLYGDVTLTCSADAKTVIDALGGFPLETT